MSCIIFTTTVMQVNLHTCNTNACVTLNCTHLRLSLDVAKDCYVRMLPRTQAFSAFSMLARKSEKQFYDVMMTFSTRFRTRFEFPGN